MDIKGVETEINIKRGFLLVCTLQQYLQSREGGERMVIKVETKYYKVNIY